MRYEVLGPLQVVGTDGGLMQLPSVAQRRLLSLLVSRAGTNVSSDYLGECLDLSAGALRVSISRLRRVVGFGSLVTAPPGYELRTDRIDTRLFEQLVARARGESDAPSDAAIATLRTALALWRGPAYAEFADEDWAVVEVHRLAELRAAAIEDLVELLLEACEWTAAITTIEPLIWEEPFRDRPHGLLMRALADSGRRIDALRAYQAYRTLLAEEVGAEPSEAIARLDRDIARCSTDIVSSRVRVP